MTARFASYGLVSVYDLVATDMCIGQVVLLAAADGECFAIIREMEQLALSTHSGKYRRTMTLRAVELGEIKEALTWTERDRGEVTVLFP